MSNFDKKPDGISYAQWLREKNLGIKVTEPIHPTGAPLSAYNYLKNKPNELYDRSLARQGKALDPEDIGEA